MFQFFRWFRLTCWCPFPEVEKFSSLGLATLTVSAKTKNSWAKLSQDSWYKVVWVMMKFGDDHFFLLQDRWRTILKKKRKMLNGKNVKVIIHNHKTSLRHFSRHMTILSFWQTHCTDVWLSWFPGFVALGNLLYGTSEVN